MEVSFSAPVAQRVFISYAHSDGATLAARLADELYQAEYTIWWDQGGISGGASWSREVEKGLDDADVVLALLSRASDVSDVCRGEHLRALDNKKTLIPILVQKNVNRPVYLHAKHYIAFDPIDDVELYRSSLKALLSSIRAGETATFPSEYAARRAARQVYSTVPPLPTNLIPRPGQIEALLSAVINETSERRVAVTAVRAMGGIGKTVLVQALCHTEAVHQAFPDGIAWTTIGQNPNDLQLLMQMREIAKVLEDDLSRYDSLAAAKNQLRTTLSQGEKSVLIVLDDVWDVRDVEPFIVDAPRSRLILTTRQKSVVRGTGAHEFSLNVLDHEQALTLLANASHTPANALPEEANAIIEECGHLPLAIAIIGALVRGEPKRWQQVLRSLQRADLSRLEVQFPDYPYPNLFKSIEVSVEALGPEVRSRYLQLAVFRSDTPVPQPTLAVLWCADEDDVSQTIDAWVEASLAIRDSNARVTLHDLQMDYVRKQISDIPALHRQLIAAYAGVCDEGWASGPDDGYFFNWLAWHLREAGQLEQLRNLLLNPLWIRAKLFHADVAALLADYEYLGDDIDLRIVRNGIQLSRNVLNRAPEALSSQLVARLTDNQSPAILELVRSLKQRGKVPWIEACKPTLAAAGGPLLVTLEGHTGSIQHLSATADGRKVLSASEDGKDAAIILWDLETCRAIRIFRGHTSYYMDVLFTLNAKGTRAFYLGDEGLNVLDLISGQLLRKVDIKISCSAVTPDQSYVAFGTKEGFISLWDLNLCTEVRSFKVYPGEVAKITITRDAKFALTSSSDGDVRLWNLESGDLIKILDDELAWVLCLAFISDDKRAVWSGSHWLRVWDLDRSKEISSLELDNLALREMVVSNDGNRALASAEIENLQHELHLWDLERGVELPILQIHAGSIRSFAVTSDSMTAFAASGDNTISVWNLRDGEYIRSLEGHGSGVNAIYLLEGDERLVSASVDHTIKLWDVGLARQKYGTPLRKIARHRGWVYGLAMSADGKHALSGSTHGYEDGTLIFWDVEAMTALWNIDLHHPVQALAMTPEGRYAAVAIGSDLQIWDLMKKRLVSLCEGGFIGNSYENTHIRSVALDRDCLLAVCGLQKGGLRFWRLGKPALLAHKEGHTGRINSVLLVPGDKYVVTGSADETLKVWDLHKHAEVLTLKGHKGGLRALSFVPNKNWVIAGSGDGKLIFWDVAAKQAQRVIQAHAEPIRALAASADGRYVGTGSEDHTFRIWDIESGNQTAVFGGDGKILSCVMTSDGAFSIVGEHTGTVHFLHLRP
jgi:WD40 repeat protein